ncbi:MAG: glycosyltransferase family 4 protein [Candidatus Fermentibacteraceae bacterium]
MKVIVTVNCRWWNASAQGAVMQALAMSRIGHDVLLQVPSSGPLASYARYSGVLRVVPGNVWSFMVSARRHHPDAICVHRGEGQTAAAVLLPGVPLVRVRNDQRRASTGLLWRLVDSRTSLVVFPSPFMAARGYQGTRRGAVDVVPFPVDTDLFTPSRLPGEKVVVSLGRLSPVKGHRVLIKAMTLMPPDWRAVIAGENDQQTSGELSEYADSHGVRDRIVFAGRLPDVRPLLARASIGVVTSLGSEVVSRAGLEMMSSGLPLLAAATNGLCDIVRDGLNGLLHSPGNHVQLAAQMRHLAENPEIGCYLGANAREYVCREFSLESVGRKWEQVLSRWCITPGSTIRKADV